MSDLQKRYHDAVQVRFDITTGYITEHLNEGGWKHYSMFVSQGFQKFTAPIKDLPIHLIQEFCGT